MQRGNVGSPVGCAAQALPKGIVLNAYLVL